MKLSELHNLNRAMVSASNHRKKYPIVRNNKVSTEYQRKINSVIRQAIKLAKKYPEIGSNL